MLRTEHPVARLAAPLLAVCLVATACTGGEDTTNAAAPAEQQESPKPVKSQWPFTGETFTGKLPQHRAVAVKIENTDSGAPQAGLGSADLVVEELVEGGLTRLAAFYYSDMPRDVGPVRSMRATDIGIVKPTKSLLVASGGAPPTMQRIRKAHIPTATEGTKGYHRVSDRPAPYNLFMNLARLPADKTKGPAPQNYLPWGSAQKLDAGKPAKKVTAQFSAGSSTRWTWSGSAWKRADSLAAKGDDFKADNVLALEVKVVDAGYTDPSGARVPESVLTGNGDATLFYDGQAYKGTWKKKSNASPIKLTSAKGGPLPVPPGHTWIELIPASGGGLSYGK
ncbi:MAG: DUF3048 domain-containing protein [Nocardioidaceae bacterium]